MEKQVEVWKSGIAGTLAVLKFNRQGDLEHEIVRPGSTVSLTKDEREINQERAANTDLDIFLNGMMMPVRLFDDSLEAEFASNPNLMSETDMKELFSAQWRVFDQKVKDISNILTLQRLAAIAEETDSATVRQVNTIKSRLDTLTAATKAEEPRPNEREQRQGFAPVTAL